MVKKRNVRDAVRPFSGSKDSRMVKTSSAFAPSVGQGTSVNIGAAGFLWINGVLVSSPNLNIVLAANATSYIFMNTTNGAVQMNTTGFPAGGVPICTATTNRNSVANLTDNRIDFFVLTGGQSTPNFEDNETPSGTIDGVNTVFTLVKPPNPGASLQLFLNGTIQQQSTGYSLSGNTVTFVFAPAINSVLIANYRF
jgi:hypothetical protein